MQYPLISEYREAIMSAEDNFDELSSLRPVLDFYGDPIMSSGNFAVVFKMKDIDTGKYYAVKCFIKDQEGRNESYAMIADELRNVSSPYIVPIRFLERELFVDSSQSDETEFPVLVMDWVDGQTLDAYLRENLEKKYSLQLLAYRFCQMSAWLMEQPFAHGDLKPDNILVREDGSLVLVDYDGFYVPAMNGQEARELGSPDFRHPQRTPQDFDEHIDDFSIATIALSLKAISIDAQLYHNYAASDRLLLSANDYHDIGNSATMQKISQLASDSELAMLLSAFYMAMVLKVLDKIQSNVFAIEMPAIIIGEGKTIIKQEDVKQIKEKYGELINVVIANSVTEIGKYAFYGCKNLISIIIPDSVAVIGKDAFYNTGWHNKQPNGVLYLDNCCIGYKGGKPVGVLSIKVSTRIIAIHAFQNCSSITSIILPNTLTKIGVGAFCGCSSLTSINIPNSVVNIGQQAFGGCTSLEKVDLPNSITEIESLTFEGCSNLTNIKIPNFVTKINSWAFMDCVGLIEVNIPKFVTKIGYGAFLRCKSLSYIAIPNSVTMIDHSAFFDCIGLKSIIVENGNKVYDSRENCNAIIETATNSLIYGCKNTIIPSSITDLEDYAFRGCIGLTNINIPSSVTYICESAFYECINLTSIAVEKENKVYDSRNNCNAIIETISNTLVVGCKNTLIPNSVTSIGDWAFYECTSLTSIFIPDSVVKIGDWAFYECTGLTSVTLSKSITEIGKGVFDRCVNLEEIIISKGYRQKFKKMLREDLCQKLVEQ